MQMTISRWLVRALGMLCLALPLTLPTAAEAAKTKPHAAKGKHPAVKKHKAIAKKAKAAKHAKKAGHRKIAKAHGPKAKTHRHAPTAALAAEKTHLALAGQRETAPAPRAARTACAIDGKVYLLANCPQAGAVLAAN